MPINFDKAIAVLNAADVPMEKTHFYRYLKLSELFVQLGIHQGHGQSARADAAVSRVYP